MNDVRWMSLHGRFDIGGESIRFLPGATVEGVAQDDDWTGQIASNLEFAQGAISLDVRFGAIDSVCALVLNTKGEQGALHIGLNLGGAYGVARYGDDWDFIKSVGKASQLQPNQVYHMRVVVGVQDVQLFVNDVLVLSTSVEVSRSPVHLYAYGSESIVFANFEWERPSVYLALSDSMRAWCGAAIHQTLAELLFEPKDLDLNYSSPSDMIAAVKESIAVVTHVGADFPHGLYHVGLCQGLMQPAIVLCHKSDWATYNLQHPLTQVLHYEDTASGLTHVSRQIASHLQAIVQIHGT